MAVRAQWHNMISIKSLIMSAVGTLLPTEDNWKISISIKLFDFVIFWLVFEIIQRMNMQNVG